jgi:hypothetical protein
MGDATATNIFDSCEHQEAIKVKRLTLSSRRTIFKLHNNPEITDYYEHQNAGFTFESVSFA